MDGNRPVRSDLIGARAIHPDIRWNDTIFWPEIIHGHAAMRAYVDKIWAVMPDVHFREVQLFSAVDAGRALYLFEQTSSAPPPLAPRLPESGGSPGDPI